MALLHPLAEVDYPIQSVKSGVSAATIDLGGSKLNGVLVWATQDIYVAVGVDAVATSSSTLVPAHKPVPFFVPPTGRVSVLQVSTPGTASAKPTNIR